MIITLAVIDQGFSLLGRRWRFFERLTEGLPLVILENGRLLEDRMRKENISREDILEAARENQGLERLEQIKYAVLERHGGISHHSAGPAREADRPRRRRAQ